MNNKEILIGTGRIESQYWRDQWKHRAIQLSGMARLFGYATSQDVSFESNSRVKQIN